MIVMNFGFRSRRARRWAVVSFFFCTFGLAFFFDFIISQDRLFLRFPRILRLTRRRVDRAPRSLARSHPRRIARSPRADRRDPWRGGAQGSRAILAPRGRERRYLQTERAGRSRRRRQPPECPP